MASKVWHNRKTFTPDRDTPARFPEDFTLVAEVHTLNPSTAYRLTNSIDRNWTENPEVVPKVGSRVRSTSVGDVIVVEVGDASRSLLVKSFGFGPVVGNTVHWEDTF